MKLLFQETTVEFEQTPTVEEVIESINALLKNEFYFSHLVVKGIEIWDEPELFLSKELGDIELVQVIAMPAKEFVNDLMLSAEEYVERAIPHIIELFESFYLNPKGNDWTRLAELLEGIQWLSTMIETVANSIACPESWGEVVTSVATLQEELRNLEEALENTDTVLIADMLQYEVLPVFKDIRKLVKERIDTEGMRHNIN